MESWTGYSFTMQSSGNENLYMFHGLCFNDNYNLELLDSSIKYIDPWNKEYKFYIDVPNPVIDLLFVFSIKDNEIAIWFIFRRGDNIYTSNQKCFVLKRKIIKKTNEIYIDFPYINNSNINFKIFDIDNEKIVLPYLLYNKNNKIESKINICIDKEYLVFSLHKIKETLCFQICKMSINRKGEENFSQMYTYIIND